MLDKPTHLHFTTHLVRNEAQSAAAILEANLFIQARDLISKITIAAKDANGMIKWITLEPTYHSILVRTAITTVKANGPSHTVSSVKEALFTILLDILNGKQQQTFFTQPEREKATRKKPHESVPLARKGSQTTASSVPILPPPPPSMLPHTHESDHGSDTVSPPDKPLPTLGAESADRPTSKPHRTPPAPPPPVSQPHAPKPSVTLAELEEMGRQLERTLREDDVECEDLLEAIPEEEERTAHLAAHSNGSLTTKQPTGLGRKNTGSAPLATTHPKTRQASKGRFKK